MMKNRMGLAHSIILILFCLGVAIPVQAQERQFANAGLLDLRNWSLKQGVVPLKGEWEFYWMQMLEPQDFLQGELNQQLNTAKSKSIVPVPATWTTYRIDQESVPNEGYATYRLQIFLSAEDRQQLLGLYLPIVDTAYRLWVNGENISNVGTVGKSRADMVPQIGKRVVYFSSTEPTLEIVIQVSNFVQRKAGLWDQILLGHSAEINSQRETNLARDIFLIVSLTIIAIYHLGLYFIRRKNRSTLYFGAVSLIIAIRMMLTGEAVYASFFPFVSWEFATHIEYLTGTLGIMFFILFVQTQYPLDTNRRMIKQTVSVSLIYSAFIIVTPARIFTYTMALLHLFVLACLIYAIYVFIVAFYRKREGGALNILAVIVLFGTVLNDVIFYNFNTQTKEIVSYGVLLFFFLQSLQLTISYSRSFNRVEELSSQLKTLNESLEEKVIQRTTDLQSSNQSLKKANQELANLHRSRQRLLTNMSHELGTPLTSIQGYLKALLDGVVTDQGKYLALIYAKTLFLERIVSDLHQVSKLDNQFISINLQEQLVEAFILELVGKYELELKNSGIELVCDRIFSMADQCEYVLKVDPIRIEQVFSAFLYKLRKTSGSARELFVTFDMISVNQRQGFIQVTLSDKRLASIGEAKKSLRANSSEHQSTTSAIDIDGTELGLEIAKEIIQEHQGHVGMKLTGEQGNALYFVLPITINSLQEETNKEVS